MNDIETVTEAFAKFLEDNSVATFGTDLFIGNVPTQPDTLYYLITAGGSPVSKLTTGERVKQYFISVYYRSLSGKDIERKLFALEELINTPGCVQLEGFNTHEVEATQFPSDEDNDNEERRIGMLQVNIKIYKKD